MDIDYIVVLDDGETYSGDGEVWLLHDDDVSRPVVELEPLHTEPKKILQIRELIAGYYAALHAGLIAE